MLFVQDIALELAPRYFFQQRPAHTCLPQSYNKQFVVIFISYRSKLFTSDSELAVVVAVLRWQAVSVALEFLFLALAPAVQKSTIRLPQSISSRIYLLLVFKHLLLILMLFPKL